jgi:hypothetical protein
MEIKPKIHFIVGHPRSGTTLLTSILDRHSQCASTPESHYFNKFIYYVDHLLVKNKGGVASYLESTRIKDWGLNWNSIRTKIVESENINSFGVFQLLVNDFAKRKKINYVLEKTPVHIRHITDILDHYRTSKIIWIIRDGRGTTSSLKKVDWASNSLNKLSKEWNRNISFGVLAKQKFPSSIHVILYEDLLIDPAKEITKIMEFMGLEFEDKQLDPNQANTSSLISKGERSWKGNIHKSLMPGRARAWEKELSLEEKIYLLSKFKFYSDQFYATDSRDYKNLSLHYSNNSWFLWIMKKLYILKSRAYIKLFDKVPK